MTKLAVAAGSKGEDAAVARQAHRVIFPTSNMDNSLIAQTSDLVGQQPVSVIAEAELAVRISSPGKDGSGH